MSDVERVLRRVDEQLPQAVERLFELLRIDSISTDPAYKDSCRRAADWLVEDLRSIGFDSARHDTPGHPMVIGHQPGASKAGPHLLFYGHYDVQPVDPLELWHRPPFEPAIEDTAAGKVIRARGAADDKGQLMTFVEACRAWKQTTGSLPTQVSLFFEGEEESGSPSLIPFMQANKSMLEADLALVCDTGMWDSETPTISTMLRGMVGEELTITGPSLDLHSGIYGGPAMNPIRVLTRILADLHDDQGRITLPGFYDGVADIPEDVRSQWASLNHDGGKFLQSVGLSQAAGEADYSVLEQIWARPSCDVNGIWGGYTGEGFKTVLPSKAHAKVSFRLVGEQDPERIQQDLHQHVEDRLPADCTVSYRSKDGSRATVMPVHAPAFRNAQKALTDEWQKEAVYAGCGGSIPVVGHIKQILGMDSLLIGFMLDDDAIHSPNEKYSLNSFHKGTRSWVRILHALAQR
ncbi:MAG: dipeptidase [Granulosicoccus sp.]|nr:dipeptidase [Granulosicoccus sp.]